jgi:hypothetical protein
MASETIINYKVEGCRMFTVPIITINFANISENHIKIKFPDIDEINMDINMQQIVICQRENNDYPFSDLYLNDNIIHSKKYFYNNGTIIVTGKCEYKETHIMVYDG